MESLICEIDNVVDEVQHSKKKRKPYIAIQALAYGNVSFVLTGKVRNIVPINNHDQRGRLVNLYQKGFKNFHKYRQIYIPDGYPVDVVCDEELECVCNLQLFCNEQSGKVQSKYIYSPKQEPLEVYDFSQEIIKIVIQDYQMRNDWKKGMDIVDVAISPYKTASGFNVTYFSARPKQIKEKEGSSDHREDFDPYSRFYPFPVPV